MKRITLLKTLLMAVGLLGSSSAWADDAYETVYTRATVNDWVEGDKADWGGNSNLAIDANGFGFPTNQTASATKSFTITANAKVKYEVDWYFGSSTARDNNYSYIQFGDKIRLCWGYSYMRAIMQVIIILLQQKMLHL